MLINISIQGGEISRVLVLGYLCPCLVITKTNVDKLIYCFARTVISRYKHTTDFINRLTSLVRYGNHIKRQPFCSISVSAKRRCGLFLSQHQFPVGSDRRHKCGNPTEAAATL